MMKLVVLFFILLSTSWGQAQSADRGTKVCLANSKVQALLAQFSFQNVVPGTTTTTAVKSLPVCDDGSLEFKTVQGLLQLRTLQDNIKGSVRTSIISQEGPFNFFKKRVRQIVFAYDEMCPRNAAAFYSLELSHSVFICPHFSTTESSLMAAMFLAHEARHADVIEHSECQAGPAYYNAIFLNQKGCDNALEDQGSYGVVTSYWWDLAHNAADETLRKTAMRYYKQELRERYNKKSFKSVYGALFLSEQNQLFFFDGINLQPYKGYLPSGPVILVDRSGLPSLFEQSSGRLLSYEFDKEWVEKSGVISNTLKNKTPAERAELLDVIYTEELICFLYKTSLQCYSRSSGDSVKINFSRIRPRTLKMMDGKYLVLVDTRGAPYEISSLANLKEYKENALVPVQGVSRVKTITQTILGPGEGVAIGINAQGQAVILNPKTGWEPIKAAGALKFKKVIPAEISEELENL